MDNKYHEGDIRLRLCGIHIAWLEPKFVNKLEKIKIKGNFKDSNAFIRAQCKKDFNIEVKTKEDVKKIDEILSSEEYLYKDKAEWIRDRIRIYKV